jgi:hypothetical protein
MSVIAKVLGQVNPTSPGDGVNLYTVPLGSYAVVSSLLVCNFGPDPILFKVTVQTPTDSSITDKNYIYHNIELEANATFAATVGLTLNGDCKVFVSASEDTVSFSLFGQEITL